ncbi:hypothetical protein [Alicyclobacillus mengziensis]|uniref:Uncharacterized protein n=1 Tax=Alicyclobacillus mengziensis TaxID=2931921 RepID=A0A9X7VVQ8_9BACL|nr:hypothetical protein [Alicyclobacillus mengziensis]QSO45464.1 hypothetical protein JZ786_12850 [Alicyclobacillus mengziensis]
MKIPKIMKFDGVNTQATGAIEKTTPLAAVTFGVAKIEVLIGFDDWTVDSVVYHGPYPKRLYRPLSLVLVTSIRDAGFFPSAMDIKRANA